LLVDLPYFHRYVGDVVRYAIGAPARPSPWGALLHEGGAIAPAQPDRDAARGVARESRTDRLPCA